MVKIKKGDRVKLIKYGCGNDKRCCEAGGHKIGAIYFINSVDGETIKIESIKNTDEGHTSDCYFGMECVEKVYETIKSLIGK